MSREIINIKYYYDKVMVVGEGGAGKGRTEGKRTQGDRVQTKKPRFRTKNAYFLCFGV